MQRRLHLLREKLIFSNLSQVQGPEENHRTFATDPREDDSPEHVKQMQNRYVQMIQSSVPTTGTEQSARTRSGNIFNNPIISQCMMGKPKFASIFGKRDPLKRVNSLAPSRSQLTEQPLARQNRGWAGHPGKPCHTLEAEALRGDSIQIKAP